MVSLAEAALISGKSEITIRRLVKAGKVASKKEATQTGFNYTVDADAVRAYYGQASAQKEPVVSGQAVQQPASTAVQAENRVRVAVADESGSSVAYWHKRAEGYEQRFHAQVRTNADLREQVGLWKGRAENAQAMLVKLLPPPSDTLEVREGKAKPETPENEKRLQAVGAGVLLLLGLAAIGFSLLYAYTALR